MRYGKRKSMKRKRQLVYLLAILAVVATLIAVLVSFGVRYARSEKAKAQIDTTTVQAEYEDTWAQTIQEEDL